MTTSTQSLAGWLLERIAEDEADPKAYMRGERDGEDMLPLGCWDAPRVLAECEAKRRIVEDVSDPNWCPEGLGDSLLRLLAVPYADRAGYREEWRP